PPGGEGTRELEMVARLPRRKDVAVVEEGESGGGSTLPQPDRLASVRPELRVQVAAAREPREPERVPPRPGEDDPAVRGERDVSRDLLPPAEVHRPPAVVAEPKILMPARGEAGGDPERRVRGARDDDPAAGLDGDALRLGLRVLVPCRDEPMIAKRAIERAVVPVAGDREEALDQSGGNDAAAVLEGEIRDHRRSLREVRGDDPLIAEARIEVAVAEIPDERE